MNFLESKGLVLVLAIVTIGLLVFNSFTMINLNYSMHTSGNMLEQMQGTIASFSQEQNYSSGEQTNNNQSNNAPLSFEEFIPKGVPPVYGAELGVSFDDPVASLDVLAALDGDLYPNGKIKFSDLSEEEQQSYIQIGYSISCEFCCSAEYITAPNGQPACGCAHSAAMRGLAKYLVQNHRAEFTDEQILEELTLWKTMFFPKQMCARALSLSSSDGTQTTNLDAVPDMVGGC